jgi:5'(3')-deoxyribonucleotidase
VSGKSSKSKAGLRIGVDCDGVLSLFEQEFMGYLVTQPGFEHYSVEGLDLSDWHFFKKFPKPMSTDEFMRHFLAGVDAGAIFTNAEPEEGAVEATHRLHEAGHSVHIVTDCSLGTVPGTSQRARAAWLARNGFYFDSITFTKDKTSVLTDVFIDDKIQNFKELAWAGVQAYLLDRPWNQSDNPDWGDTLGEVGLKMIDKHRRVSSMKEFADILCMEVANA